MKIYLGADHNGFALKKNLREYLGKAGYDVVDDGDVELRPDDDYPVFAQKVVNDLLLSDDREPRGILICGSGQGMCMDANRFKGIRALLGYSRESIKDARNDDDANVLCLPSIHFNDGTANSLVETFLNTPFAGASRYKRRIHEMDDI